MTRGQTWLDLFALRRDDFVLQQDGGSYVRAGKPLTEEAAEAHLRGQVTVSLYALRGSECLWGALEGDYDGALVDLQRLAFLLLRHNFRPALEASRREGHLWLLCCEPVEAVSIRRLLLGAVQELHLPLKEGAKEGLEVRPDRDSTDSYGSAMRGPLGVHQLTRKWYPLLDLLSLEPLEPLTIDGQLAFWQSGPKATKEEIEAASLCFPDHRQPKPLSSSNFAKIAAQELDILFWAERLTRLQRQGLTYRGLCPFHSESEPSFVIWPEQGRFYCFGCQEWGDAYDLRAKAEARPLAEVLKEARYG